MAERRPDARAADPRPARLSPLQQAWADYQCHTASCARCRIANGGRCEEAIGLWRTHQELCDEAYRRLGGEVV